MGSGMVECKLEMSILAILLALGIGFGYSYPQMLSLIIHLGRVPGALPDSEL